MIFKHQRYFDLVGANVYLVPVGLVRKRWWSKKYPICIEMAPNAKHKLLAGFGQSYSSNDIALSSASAQFPNKTHLSAELMKRERETNSATAIDKKNVVIYLFARASREKVALTFYDAYMQTDYSKFVVYLSENNVVM